MVHAGNQRGSGASSRHGGRFASAFESLESRRLFATFNLSDYLPINSTDTWSYSGTASDPSTGQLPATGTLTYSLLGNGKTGESFAVTPTGGLPGTFIRTFENDSGGLKVVKTERQIGDDYLDDFGTGYSWLPATFSDGVSALSNFNQAETLTRMNSMGSVLFSGTGTATGSIFVLGLESISTPAGNFQALKVQEQSQSDRISGSTDFQGVFNLTVWLVKDLGIAKVSYTATETVSQSGGPGTLISSAVFNLSLTGTTHVDINGAPAIKGTGGMAIANGDVTPVRPDGTAFGVFATHSMGGITTFTITNTGTQKLRLGNDNGPAIVISGANAADFAVISGPGAMIAPGASKTFQVQFDPSAPGTRNATVTVNSRSLTTSTYSFAIKGTGQDQGQIGVQGGVTPMDIVSGSTTASFANGTRFGMVPGDGAHSFGRRFIVSNPGTGPFAFTGVPKIMISGLDASEFSVILDPSSLLNNGATTMFRIRFKPGSAGFKKAFVSIMNDSTNTALFTFAITGTGT